ncbi:hypothetical protein COX67_03395 [Candidatus Falkowbacteria bacterium CG_4_10_14_0_2_um_filter_36_22]|uniref:DNA polymerase III subunit gamma/tau n=2 Tax=Candidatus Falkowiibacteriota TaxID=1752728 RepID=A0A1J4TCJ0_9BACT|nr:MAG: DNA polymerase III, subunit gamma and tau [Candidatus Falkowbacteria bacterium CG1_02_37_44]PIV51835.1 MAG: hypothetical protein COS18_01900 [Candidatus Falkowbacteria bacterium CG02_land_8_20_14_3_00_36_14]PIX10894.1 MAG: hypothetical protein COZ73_04205 [Candidatus Falkowbacteria bacterium CG_4_8_14_3_um_filter_36_11]PJA10750.1 MAG: hypothetical protein COX67_03395 [Candidatus Falkowbacteria bacterium CG_4_10_14_0_2_um_filter_36_22]
MATLYRKYRPQNFKEVVGQNHIKLTLEQEVESGKIAHAYIFCGPRAVGKTTLARVLAKAVNCERIKAGEHEPCNKCSSCQDITIGRNMDIMEIDAASHTGVDNVRENIIASTRIFPSRSKYKVFIIDEVHMLSLSAFNALLKIIEEPPAYVLFILCTTEIHKVPTTIISRCQRFDFKRISLSDMTGKLSYIVKKENIKINKSILESIARQSEGYMRDAESLLGQIVSIGGREITQKEADLVIPRSDLAEVINLIEYLAKKDAAAGIGLVNKLVDEGVDLKVFLRDLIEILRKIILAKINPALAEKFGLELGENLEIKINEISHDLDIANLLIIIEQFINAKEKLKGSFIPQMPMEMAIIEISAAKKIKDIPGVKINPPATGFNGLNEKNNVPDREVSAPIAKFSQAGDMNNNIILAKWNEVLAKIKKYNHSLSFILRACEPQHISGNKISLAFKYKFHKDRLSDSKIKLLVERVLSEVYGTVMNIESVVDENIELAENNGKAEANGNTQIKSEEKGNKNTAIDNLLKNLGGRIIG